MSSHGQAFALICVNCVGLLALNAVGRQRSNVWIMLAGAVTKITWDLVFIPRDGVWGACVGSVVTEVVVTILIVGRARRWYPPAAWMRAWAGAGLAAVAGMAAAATLATLPVRLAVGVVVFLGVAVVSGALRRADLTTLQTLWRSRMAATGGVS